MGRFHLFSLLVIVVVLTGCTSLEEPGSTEATASEPTGEDLTVDDPAGNATEAEDETERTSRPQNPWGKEEIVVGLTNRSRYPRNYTPFLLNATAYWMEHDEEYATYEVNYSVQPGAADPDLAVVVEDSIERCGGVYSDEETGGCAPLLNGSHRVSDVVEIALTAQLSDNATRRTLLHEFGHVLGIRHGEPPRTIMRHITRVEKRRLPWGKRRLSIHFDISDDRWNVRDHIPAAVDEIERQTGTEFSVVEERRSADVVVEERAASLDCGLERGAVAVGDPASCVAARAEDVDRDGRWEYVIHVSSDVSRETFLWHVGRWIYTGYGLSDEDLPWAFSGDDTYQKRSSWP